LKLLPALADSVQKDLNEAVGLALSYALSSVK